MNYSGPPVNSDRFCNFRCLMHKTLECRQRGPGNKTKIILLCSFLGELSVFVAPVHHLPPLPTCLLCPPDWLHCLLVCDVLNVRQFSLSASPGDQIRRSDPGMFFFFAYSVLASIHTLYCRVEYGEVKGVRHEMCVGVCETPAGRVRGGSVSSLWSAPLYPGRRLSSPHPHDSPLQRLRGLVVFLWRLLQCPGRPSCDFVSMLGHLPTELAHS